MLEFLMNQDQVDVNVKERRGWNLLHLAARLVILHVCNDYAERDTQRERGDRARK